MAKTRRDRKARPCTALQGSSTVQLAVMAGTAGQWAHSHKLVWPTPSRSHKWNALLFAFTRPAPQASGPALIGSVKWPLQYKYNTQLHSQRILISQLTVLETMTPIGFLEAS